jgi:hypothetical protein
MDPGPSSRASAFRPGEAPGSLRARTGTGAVLAGLLRCKVGRGPLARRWTCVLKVGATRSSGSLAAVPVTSDPRSPSRSVSEDFTAQVEYRIVRNGVVRAVEDGRVQRVDVCDAHPELLRAARNVGRPTKEVCPLCDDGRLVTVTFVFGAKLPAGGRCPGTAAELKALCRRPEPVLCYEVEVCPSCAWHHLMRKYPAGGVRKKEDRMTSKTNGSTQRKGSS